ncbi:MAG: glycosyltransferase family 2 protein [Candidatus Omnitrophica bacterium]|nr:glycosyltransferase family 2 protein [Candidatus Omnitrophota bacterium]
MKELELSVIVPAYNEALRLENSLLKMINFFKQRRMDAEIIVVDDGSRDQTAEVARKCLGSFPGEIIRHPRNQGKGAAVKTGMLRGRARYLLFSDADLSTPIEEVDRMIGYMRSGYEVVLGSRALDRSKVEIRQNILRETMGRIYNRIAQFLVFNSIKDSQCGFKCFSRRAAQDLFRAQKIMGFSFDAEIVYLTQKKGYRLLEMPVVWRNSPQSTLSIVWDPLWMFLDLLRIRWLHRNDV